MKKSLSLNKAERQFIQKASPFEKPLTQLRFQRVAGRAVEIIQVEYAYGGMYQERHCTLRQEVNLTTGEVSDRIIYGRRAASCVR